MQVLQAGTRQSESVLLNAASSKTFSQGTQNSAAAVQQANAHIDSSVTAVKVQWNDADSKR